MQSSNAMQARVLSEHAGAAAPSLGSADAKGGAPSGAPAAEGAPPLDPRLTANLKFDIPSGVVVFLVALPLCLGIALASGAPLLSGIVAGIVGGLVIPLVSRSQLSVSGPAAGLAAIVLTGITQLRSFEAFALAVVIGGVLQLGLGLLRAGAISHFFPSSVIKGMLAAIGVLLILKQLPHAVGFDKDNFASESFKADGGNTFSMLGQAMQSIEWGAFILSALSLAILVGWEKSRFAKISWLPAPLVAVLFAVMGNELFRAAVPSLALDQKHLVTLPIGEGSQGLLSALQLPDWSAITRPEVWVLGVTLAIVASLETLLNLEAVDRIDPWRRKSPPNRELVAQGLGNMVSGFAGGLPVTSVIVRSSANVNSGARTRISAFVHGALLLLAVVFAAGLLARIPLACLAAILLATGYKLAKPKLFAEMYKLGWSQFIPFVVTIAAVVLTDLLKGIAIGLAVGVVFVLKSNMSRVFDVIHEGARVTIRFNKEAYFFTQGKLVALFDRLPSDSHVVVDAQGASYVDHDVVELIRRFQKSAPQRNINVEVRGL
ncbi:membrane protein [Sorangium cellulosum]|uniref:Membrane protein n=1 Tax=Sorangium cellulosum TaxID=56 RepID=A0A2L0F4Z6_SORCE|nr:SulP family inorganic anion transporter [Sorangium cellulosum]AUX46668.1 membrane protein [Sorangium cellulosum]